MDETPATETTEQPEAAPAIEAEPAAAVEAEPQQEAAQPVVEPEPVAAAAAAEPAETEPAAAPQLEKQTAADPPNVLIDRLAELEEKIARYEQLESDRQAEMLQRQSATRKNILQEWGILDESYMQLAPSIADADPTTDEGREALRQWMTKHPSLFKKAPTLEGLTDGDKKNNKSSFNRRLSFGEAVKKLRGN